MNAELIVSFVGINKEDLAAALQGLRDVEQKDPKRIEMYILVNSPDLSTEEVTGMLQSIKPPLPYMKVFGKGSTLGASIKIHDGR